MIWGVVFATSFDAACGGKTAATFLMIDVSPRATAMGGAAVAVSDDPSATYYNPAGLINLQGTKVMFAHNRWFSGITHDTASWARHITRNTTLGFSATGLYAGGLKRTPDDYAHAMSGQGDKFFSLDGVVGVSLAHEVTPRLSLGITAKAIYQRIDKEFGTSGAVDLGGMYQMAPFTLGVSIRHIGPRMGILDKVFPLPTIASIGFGWRTGRSILTLELNKGLEEDGPGIARLGVEWSMVGDALKVRAGYRHNLSGPNGDQWWSGLSAGLGIKISSFQLDYSFTPYGDGLDHNHKTSLTIGL